MQAKTIRKRKKVSAEQRARTRKRVERQQKRKASSRPHYRLDLDKERYPEHAVVAEKIEKLIARKKFLPTATRGILIVDELDNDRIDLLIEKYPWVVDKILASQQPRTDPDDLAQLVARKVQEVLEGMSIPATGLVATPALKPMSTFMQLPVPDVEDTVVIKRDSTAGVNAANSFLDAAFAFQPTPKSSSGIKKMKGFENITGPVVDDDDDLPVLKKSDVRH